MRRIAAVCGLTAVVSIIWILLARDGEQRAPIEDRPASAVGDVDTTPVPVPESAGPAIVSVPFEAAHQEPARSESAAAPWIRGIIVDDRDLPLVGAQLLVLPLRRQSPMLRSDPDGEFEIRRQPEDPDEGIRIEAQYDGHDLGRSEQRIAWGTGGVKIVLRRGAGVRLIVVDGDTQAAIERFAIYCVATGSGMRSSRSSGDMKRRFSGDHPGGILDISKLTRGPTALRVEPIGTDHFQSRVHRFVAGADGEGSLRIAVHRGVPSVIRVRTKDGRPMAGTKVEIIRRVEDEEIDIHVHVLKPGSSSSTFIPEVIDSGNSDPEGLFQFTGPPHERLAVRVLGPGHQPTAQDFVLERGSETVDVIVTSGASLVGTVGPERFLTEVRLPDTSEANRTRYAPGVVLTRRDQKRVRFPPDHKGSPITNDGSFAIHGIPPGTWDIELSYLRRVGQGVSFAAMPIRDGLTFQEGEIVRLDLDLTHLLQSTLRARVIVNGRPAAGLRVVLSGVALTGSRPRLNMFWTPTADAEGRFELVLVPAEYQLVLRDKNVFLADAAPVILDGGATVDHSFAFEGALAEVRVLASDGATPVGGVTLVIEPANPSDNHILDTWTTPLSGTDGVIRIAAFNIGIPVHVKVWSRELQPPDDRMAMMRRTGNFPQPTMVAEAGSFRGSLPASVVLPASLGF